MLKVKLYKLLVCVLRRFLENTKMDSATFRVLALFVVLASVPSVRVGFCFIISFNLFLMNIVFFYNATWCGDLWDTLDFLGTQLLRFTLYEMFVAGVIAFLPAVGQVILRVLSFQR